MGLRHPRLLLSIEPRVFSDAIEQLLNAGGVDRVTVVPPGTDPHGSFDIAIVTSSKPGDVDAEVVIDLSDSMLGIGTVRGENGDEVIDLRDLVDVIDLLDQRVAGEHLRADGLRHLGI